MAFSARKILRKCSPLLISLVAHALVLGTLYLIWDSLFSPPDLSRFEVEEEIFDVELVPLSELRESLHESREGTVGAAATISTLPVIENSSRNND